MAYSATRSKPSSGDGVTQATNKLADLAYNGRTQTAATSNLHAPTAATAATLTKAAGGAGTYHTIRGVDVSYDSTPTGGAFTIEDVSGTTVYSVAIPAAGLYQIRWPRAIKSAAANTAMIFTLASGGGSVVGRLNLVGYQLES